MILFTILELIILAIFTCYLVYEYSSKDIPIYIKMVVFVSWYVNFVTLALIPLDIYYTISNGNVSNADPNTDNNTNNQDQLMMWVWRTIYWTSFAFSWVILPILQEYVDSGEFTPKNKLIKSLKVNMIFYIVILAIGIIAIFIWCIFHSFGDITNIPTWIMMFSTGFGISLIILLLGYGLVMIPKRYFQRTRKDINLKYYEFQLSMLEDQKNNMAVELEDLIKLIIVIFRMHDTDLEIRSFCNQILESLPKELVSAAEDNINKYRDDVSNDEIIGVNMNKITGLNQKIKKKLHELRRLEVKSDLLIDQALFLEDVINSCDSKTWKIYSNQSNNNINNTSESTFKKYLEGIKWLWYVKIQKYFLMVIGVVAVVFSFTILIGEMFIFMSKDNDSGIFSFIYEEPCIGIQIICLIPLLYLAVCVYFALFNINLTGLYGLYTHHQTDAGSLLFSGVNFSRISCPLAYNFLQMIKIDNTAFMSCMGFANITLTKAYEYFPWILVLLIVFNIFDCYGKILSALGLIRFKFSTNFSDERIDEGKKLLQRSRLSSKRRLFSDADKLQDPQSNGNVNIQIFPDNDKPISSSIEDSSSQLYAPLNPKRSKALVYVRHQSSTKGFPKA